MEVLKIKSQLLNLNIWQNLNYRYNQNKTIPTSQYPFVTHYIRFNYFNSSFLELDTLLVLITPQKHNFVISTLIVEQHCNASLFFAPARDTEKPKVSARFI